MNKDTNNNPPTRISAKTAENIAEKAADKAIKKNSKKFIIGILVAVVLCALAGGGVVFAMMYNSPEKAATDAIVKLMSAEKLSTSADFSMKPKDDMSELESISGKFSSVSNSLDSSVSISAKIALDSGDDFDLGLDTVATSDDNTIYFKTKGVDDVVNTLLLSELDNTDDTDDDYTAYGVDSVEADDDTLSLDSLEVIEDNSSYASGIIDAIGDVDDIWWKLSLSEFLEKTDGLFGVSYKSGAESCIHDTFVNSRADLAKYAESYKEHPFIIAENSDKTFSKGKAYSISLDSEEMAAFINSLSLENRGNELVSCLIDTNEQTISKDDTKVDAKDLDEIIDELPDIYIAVSDWTHTLNGLVIDYSNDDIKGDLDIEFTYPDEVEIKTPSDSKSLITKVTDVFDSLTNFSSL